MSEEKKDTQVSPAQGKKKKSSKVLGVVVEEPFCPICSKLGHREKFIKVEGLISVSRNPQEAKGIPRVVDCTGGCRYGLEPFYSPKSDGSFCYMLLRSDRDPEAIVNHYWLRPEWFGTPDE